jgi:multimeric flavodoxin WrbA
MSDTYQVVALNGSPHEGMGNTSQLLAMLKESLAQEGLALREIFLSQHYLEYCTGCAMCLDKGDCWIRDDYKGLMKQVLEADAFILASPVYFLAVTAQLKTFIDRSLGYGHRPRGTWKPGLVVCCSAGYGATQVAQYMSQILRAFGAFSVGELTAIGVGPGSFLGREAVEARAVDLARDLAQSVKQGRRYPATDVDLAYWHFMGNLIKDHKDFMKADHEHWEKHNLYDSFENYVGQTRSQAAFSPEIYEHWLKSLMARQKAKQEANKA